VKGSLGVAIASSRLLAKNNAPQSIDTDEENRKEQENMDENNEKQFLKRQTAQEESVFTKELTKLGNQAVKMSLISGHGYHGGKYEILCNGQIFLLTPEQAHSYLKDLVKQHQRK
jgi:hypothetical protein